MNVIENETGKVLNDIGALSQIPGAMEMLATEASKQSGQQMPVRLYSMGGPVSFDGGGLAQAAQMTREGGRGDDEMLVHLSPEEYEALVAMWGEPEINPQTGLPEYGFLSKLWKGVKKAVKGIVKSPIFGLVAPVALNMFAPGLGGAIGGALGLGSKAAPMVGNALVRGGIGALGGGKEGAISGALTGLTQSGLGKTIGGKLGLEGMPGQLAGDALLGGATAQVAGGDFMTGATGQALQGLTLPAQEKFIGNLIGKIAPGAEGYGGGPSMADEGFDPLGASAPQTIGMPEAAAETAGGGGNFLSKSLDWMKEHPYLTAGGALALAGAAGRGGGGGGGGGGPIPVPDEFNEPLPNLSFDRSAMPVEDYYSYGQGGGEQSFFSNNVLPSGTNTGNSALDRPGTGAPPSGGGAGGTYTGSEQPRSLPDGMAGLIGKAAYQARGWTYDEETGMVYPPGWFYGGPQSGATQSVYSAMGGIVRRYAGGGSVRGPGTGRSDDIPAMVSDGEYVVDAESVALLGDGSVDAGANRLDEMRKNLRMHKGGKLSKGQFSDKAKRPEEYMKGGKIKKSKGNAMKLLKSFSSDLESAVSSGNKKRVSEIFAQIDLDSPGLGDRLTQHLADGGKVSRVADVVREFFDMDLSQRGPTERRAAKRVGEGDSPGRRLTDGELAEIAREMGGFTKDSKFIAKFRRELRNRRRAEAVGGSK